MFFDDDEFIDEHGTHMVTENKVDKKFTFDERKLPLDVLKIAFGHSRIAISEGDGLYRVID